MPLTDKILPNGLRLLAEPIAATKSAAIGFWFSRGSRDEEPPSYGVTHFVEHMLFKGTDTLTAYDISRFFDKTGGYVNAFTEREFLCVHCLVPHRYVLEAVEIMYSMIYRSVFNDDEIEKERNVIISEILSSEDDPEEMCLDMAFSLMYPDHGISRPIAGNVTDIVSLSGSGIREFYKNRIQLCLPMVAAAGNISVSDLSNHLEKLFSGKYAELENPKQYTPLWQSGRFFPVSRFSQTQILLSYPLKTLKTEKDWCSWTLINAIIGDTSSSRLFQNIREKKGLCYSTYSFFVNNRDTAFWGAYVATPPEQTLAAVDSILLEIAAIRNHFFLESEIEDSRSHLIGELDLSSEDNENRMKRLARQFYFNGSVLLQDEIVEIYRNISTNEIKECLKNFFNDFDESLIIYADKAEIKKCRKKWQYK